MQVDDIKRLHAQQSRDKALGLERTHYVDELLRCVTILNVAEPFQIRRVYERLEEMMRGLKAHVEDVEIHFGGKG